MEKIDFNYIRKRYEVLKNNVEKLPVPELNKKLVIEFVESCLVGMHGKKLGKARAVRTLQSLINLCLLLQESEGKIWLEVTKMDIKSLLLKIGEKPSWGEWERYVTLSVLRKFMTWVRCEYGYPENYPDREKLINLLPLMKYPPECKYNIDKPNKLKPFNEIPTAQEIHWMMEACDTYKDKAEGIRDKAMIAILEEVGTRIGGLGTLQIKSITFDSLGGRIAISDKTMNGEPIRIIKSAGHLKAWLDIHPEKANPDSSLWVNLRPSSKKKEMDYPGMRKSLKKAVKTHNKLAELNGLPKITRRIHFHAFRYFAQTRDMLDGMPVSVQCMQRGWSVTSKQPARYARVTPQQADEWLSAKYGLTDKINETASKGPVNKDIQKRQPVPKKEDIPGYR